MKFSVQLDGFRFQAVDETTGATNLADVATIEADCAEMAEVEFKKKMGITNTTRKFTIHKMREPGATEDAQDEDLPDPELDEPEADEPAPEKPKAKGRRSLVSDPDGVKDEIAKL